jgi:hypothetical protein
MTTTTLLLLCLGCTIGSCIGNLIANRYLKP